jgi:4-hydroxybenzoyl-CoA thioesterase
VFIHQRPVRFEDVDAAGLVFFPRVLGYCHDALAELLASVEGGYAALVLERGIGLPTVHVDVDFTAPLRFGDTARIELRVARIGRSSATFELDLSRLRDGARAARVRVICACTELTTLRSIEWPSDVRPILEAHLITSTEEPPPDPGRGARP